MHFLSLHSPILGRRSSIITPRSSPQGCESAKLNDKQGNISVTYKVLWYPHDFNSRGTGKSLHYGHTVDALDFPLPSSSGSEATGKIWLKARNSFCPIETT